MLRSTLQQMTEEFKKMHKKTGITKRGLGPDQSHYNNSRLWFILPITLAQITRITHHPQVNIH